KRAFGSGLSVFTPADLPLANRRPITRLMYTSERTSGRVFERVRENFFQKVFPNKKENKILKEGKNIWQKYLQKTTEERNTAVSSRRRTSGMK
ncbi:MAG: hypothetical protein IJM45_03635, partial [Clostridia bacterium]|nr:hypothetical protein [Clostridia bacterium]